MLSLSLNPGSFTLKDGTITITESIFSLVIKEEIENFRRISLDEEVDIFVHDQLGVRFWANEGQPVEIQVLFKVEDKERKPVFPNAAFKGDFTFMDSKFILPVYFKDLLDKYEFVQDEDSLQYGILMYKHIADEVVYTFTLDKSSGEVTTISIASFMPSLS
ncbi:DUF7738 domain-containing protein [Hymenobacter terrenus]|uniref:DUF7738 domain-containing protein n=1 Tax=Hymenobacter terrenus TaxID=1629124 RepID=UPI000619F369|nr:hypothetical protein [Hymenobacter terrenus]